MTDAFSLEDCGDQYLDLRLLGLILWRGKWWLLAFLIVFVAATAVLSFWVLTPEYQASARVVVDFPRIPSTISSFAPTPYSIPDLKTLVEVLQGDEVLQKVLEGEDLDLETLRARAQAETFGRRGIRLTVRDTDPQRAARLANRWANLVEDEARAMYGLDTIESHWKAILQQSLTAYEEVTKRIRDLEDDAAMNTLQWEQLKETYLCGLQRQKSLTIVSVEIEHLQDQFHARPQDAILTPAESLKVWALTSKDWHTLNCNEVSVLLEDVILPVSPPTNLQVRDALNMLKKTHTILTTLLSELEIEQANLEPQIQVLAAQQIRTEHIFEDLLSQQESAWSTYALLRDQSMWFQGMRQKGAIVREIQEAQPPSAPVAPRPALNIVVAALLGLIVGAAVVLIKEEWLSQDGAKGDTL